MKWNTLQRRVGLTRKFFRESIIRNTLLHPPSRGEFVRSKSPLEELLGVGFLTKLCLIKKWTYLVPKLQFGNSFAVNTKFYSLVRPIIISIIFCLKMFSLSSAQDYTHPRDMNLPKSAFERPNAHDYQVKLKNGLVAYLVEDHTVPLVSLTAIVHAGKADGSKQGAAEVLAEVLQKKGAASMYAGGFKISLDNMAADYRVSITQEMTEITLNVPAGDTWGALLLLAQTLRDPAISADVITIMRKRSSNEGSPSEKATGESRPVLYEGSLTAALQRFESILFANHPYGKHPNALDYRRLTVDDIRSFHRKFFIPANTVLAISGDFSAQELQLAFQQNFGDWQQAPVPNRSVVPEVKTSESRQIHTYESPKLQAWMVLGHELPTVPLADLAALQVMNYILGGGHFDTRLFRETRDKRGLTNDDSGFLEPYWHGPGTYTFRTYGRPEVIHLLAELTLNEIDRIRSELVSEKELFVAKNALAAGEFEMKFENGHTTARTFAEEWLRYGNHKASVSYRERVRAVTAQDVFAAAQKYLHPERMQMVLMGPIEKVRKATYPEGTMRLEDFGEFVVGK
jgi:zinc protease